MRNLQDVLVNDYQLDLTGWTLGWATGISDDGKTIVGWGTNPSGFNESWIAHIPEPASVGILLIGGAALLRRRHSPFQAGARSSRSPRQGMVRLGDGFRS